METVCNGRTSEEYKRQRERETVNRLLKPHACVHRRLCNRRPVYNYAGNDAAPLAERGISELRAMLMLAFDLFYTER
jgi:hypothetical protein